MKISRVAVRLLRVDAEPWYMGRPVPPDQPATWDYPLLEIETDEGVVGRATGYGTLGMGRANAAALVDVFRPALLGRDPMHIEEIWQDLRRLQRHLYNLTDAARGQIDVALWDIKGQVAGLPIASLLGGFRDAVLSYGTGSYFLDTPEDMHAEAARIKGLGYRGCKFNLYDGPARDIPRLRAAREAVGDAFPLMLDASSFYSFGDALLVGRELDRLAYWWFEEPLYDRQIGNLVELTRRLETPVLVGETSSLAELPELVRQRAGDLVRGDVLIKSGITGLMKAIGLCELSGVGLELHTCASPLLDVANLHVAGATASCQWVESHHPMFRFGLRGQPLDIDGQGFLAVPQAPGLGVELDWDWIDDHTTATP